MILGKKKTCCARAKRLGVYFKQSKMSSIIQKLRKAKPAKPLQFEFDEDAKKKPENLPIMRRVTFEDENPATDQDRQKWAETRASQRTDETGQPVEGWPARIRAMQADGRLIERGKGVWYHNFT